MNMHPPQLQRQHDEAMERRQKLWSGKSKISVLAAPRAADPLTVARAHIRQLESEKDALELDLADARSRILDMAEQICVINDLKLDETPIQRRSVAEIIREVMRDFHGITWEEVKSVRRERRLTSARQHCMAALYAQRPDLSYPMIGRLFNRDHSTVVHAVQKIAAARAKV